MTRRTVPMLLIAAAVLFCCVLSFYRATEAAAPPAKAPFANSVDQRFQMINELKGIRALLKEQNALLSTSETAQRNLRFTLRDRRFQCMTPD